MGNLAANQKKVVRLTRAVRLGGVLATERVISSEMVLPAYSGCWSTTRCLSLDLVTAMSVSFDGVPSFKKSAWYNRGCKKVRLGKTVAGDSTISSGDEVEDYLDDGM